MKQFAIEHFEFSTLDFMDKFDGEPENFFAMVEASIDPFEGSYDEPPDDNFYFHVRELSQVFDDGTFSMVKNDHPYYDEIVEHLNTLIHEHPFDFE